MDLVERVGYASAFSFKYSPRPGTPGASLDEQVPDAVMGERLAELQALIADQQRAFNLAMVGRSCDVLLEKRGRNPGQLTGRSPWLQPVQLDLPETRIGEIVAVEITDTGTNSLFARPVNGQDVQVA